MSNALRIGNRSINAAEVSPEDQLPDNVYHYDGKDIRSLTEQVARCGNNLNQYAKRANENGSIYVADIMDLQEQFQEILDTERSIFLKLAALK